MGKVGYCNPPVEHRFSKTNPHPAGPRGPYLTSFLKRCLNKKIKYKDPKTQKIIKGTVRDALMWQLISNGCRGENDAIKEILNRVDGKVIDRIEGRGFDSKTIVNIIKTYKEDKIDSSPVRAGTTVGEQNNP